MSASLARARRRMVLQHLRPAGIVDARVLAAMGRVPREAFVPPSVAAFAYDDQALPLGHGQTISQPVIVAAMLQALELVGDERVLDVGTGSGYSAALLAELAAEVTGIERLVVLADRARQVLAELGYARLRVEVGDGTLGWPAGAPYDAIVVAAGGPRVPEALLAQLAPGGRLVMPVGDGRSQALVRVGRDAAGAVHETRLGAVRFVPLIGSQGWIA
ncbi:MAG: protein-L-isoaspartate(D-aspartate) O-methyltransferase [Pseudomonadota bacterium]